MKSAFDVLRVFPHSKGLYHLTEYSIAVGLHDYTHLHNHIVQGQISRTGSGAGAELGMQNRLVNLEFLTRRGLQ